MPQIFVQSAEAFAIFVKEPMKIYTKHFSIVNGTRDYQCTRFQLSSLHSEIFICTSIQNQLPRFSRIGLHRQKTFFSKLICFSRKGHCLVCSQKKITSNADVFLGNVKVNTYEGKKKIFLNAY